MEAQGGQFKCCTTIEQKRSDGKGLQDGVGNHYDKCKVEAESGGGGEGAGG